MRSAIITAAALFTAALAAPNASLGKKFEARGAKCMSDDDAQQVATNFKDLIANYSDDLADAAMTTDFSDYSDSVNELINGGCPDGPATLGSPTFSSLEEFKAGQSAQPPIPFEQLKLWHNCDTVVIRWKSAQTPQQVTGNIVMETVAAPEGNEYPWQIQTVYSEFNSGAWLVNLGVFNPTCPAPAPSRKLRRGL